METMGLGCLPGYGTYLLRKSTKALEGDLQWH